jgi:hypothetical protein
MQALMKDWREKKEQGLIVMPKKHNISKKILGKDWHLLVVQNTDGTNVTEPLGLELGLKKMKGFSS